MIRSLLKKPYARRKAQRPLPGTATFRLLAVLVALLAGQMASAQWSNGTLASARHSIAGATNGTKMYFAGGSTSPGSASTIDVYDGSTSSWGAPLTLPNPRYGVAAASVGTKVFFAGGANNAVITNAIDVYDASSSSWSLLALPTARMYLAAASVGNKVYFAGGEDANAVSSSVDVYDAVAGTWSSLTLPNPRADLAAAAVGNKIYFGGGKDAAYIPSNVVDVYDVSTGTWSTLTMPHARYFLAAASIGNTIYFGGGFDAGGNVTDVIDVYNTVSGTWHTQNLPVARSFPAAAALSNQIFFAGGADQDDIPSDNIQIFTSACTAPTAYIVGGGGSYCSGGSGFAISLSNSDLGVDYQLIMGGNPVGSPIAGTGSAIAFPVQTAAGTYTVAGTDDNTGNCTTTMTGSATITVNPLPQGSLNANGPFTGTGNGQLTFTASVGTGPFTVVYNNGTSNQTVTGVVSGTPFNTTPGTITTTTTYTLVSVADANCSRASSFTGGSATITVTPLTGLAFDGSDDYISVNYNLNDASQTLEAWVKPLSAARMFVISNDNPGSFGAGFAVNNYALEIDCHNVFITVPGTLFSNGTWAHVAVVYEAGARVRAYVNGIEVYNAIPNTTWPSSLNGAANYLIGRHNQSLLLTWNGAIDEVRVWNRSLCQAEIQNNMNGELPTPASQAGLVSNYRFDEGVAAGNNTSITTAMDASASNIPGTLNNFNLTASNTTSNFLAGAPAITGAVTPFVVPIPATPAVTAGGPTTFCVGSSVLLSTPLVTGYTYQWANNGNNINGATANTYSATAAGSYTVTVTNSCGGSATSAATAVTTNPPPAFTACPVSPLSGTTAIGTCSGAVSYTSTATGTPTPTYTYTFSGATTGSGSGTGSGSSFGKGTTNVVVTATNTCGATNCNFDVVVTDNIAPVLACGTNQTVNVATGTCAANYTITDPITDNCTGATWGYSVSGATTINAVTGIADGSNSPVLSLNKGLNTITLTGTDGTNAAANCSYTITVLDNIAPTLACITNQTLSADAGVCTASYTITDPITDNCTGASWGYTLSGATTGTATGIADGSNSTAITFNRGVTTVTLSGTDGTNAAGGCSFTVTVNDTQAPVVTVPAPVVVNNTPGTCGAVVNYAAPTAADNCSNTTVSQTYSYTGNTQTFTVPFGVTSIKVKAWGAGGGGAGGDGQVGGAGGGGGYATSTLAVNPGDVLTLYVGGGGANGSGCVTNTGGGLGGFGYGNGGKGGNAGNGGCSGGGGGGGGATAIVKVSTPLIIAAGGGGGGGAGNDVPGTIGGGGGANGSASSNANSGTSGGTAGANSTNAGISAPNKSGDGGGPGGGGGGLLGGGGGTTPNCDCTAGSGAGGTSLGTTKANGTGQTPGNSTDASLCTNCARGGNGAASASSGASGNNGSLVISYGLTLTQTAGLASGATFPIGVTTNTYQATDVSGNQSSSSFTVTVVDNQNPTLVNVPANISVNNTPGVCGATVNYTAPTASDNCSGATATRIAGLASGSVFPVGVTTVTYRATDASGNLSAPQSFTVTVTDNQNPTVVNLPANISVPNTPGLCSAVVSWTAPTAADNCSATIAQTAGQASGSTFPVGGPYTITYRATDASGNLSAPQSFTVTVTDSEAPVLSLPANATVNSQDPTTVAALGSATATDNCGVQGAVTYSDASTKDSNPNNTGYYNYTITRTWSATDVHGLTGTGNQIITVHDVTAPVVTSPAAVAQCNNGTNTVSQTVTATDAASSPLTYIYTITGATTGSGSGATATANYAVGTSTITWTVTDVSGNANNSATSTVTIYAQPSIAVTSTVSPSCNGFTNGSINTTTSGGTPGYNYTWTPSGPNAPNRTGLSAGTYSVTVTDQHSCAATTSATLTQPSTLVGGTTTGTFAIPNCPAYNLYLGYGATNDTLTTAASGGTSPYSYAWTPATGTTILTSKHVVTPAATTTYTATITDAHGCVATTSYQVKVLDIHCGPAYVGRERNNTVTVCHNGVSACVSPALAATYINGGECPGTCNTAVRGVAENTVTNGAHSFTGLITVYPNPAHTTVNVQLTGIGSYYKSYQIIDLTGKLIAQQSGEEGVGAELITINVADYAHGVYLVRVVGRNNTTAIARFTVD